MAKANYIKHYANHEVPGEERNNLNAPRPKGRASFIPHIPTHDTPGEERTSLPPEPKKQKKPTLKHLNIPIRPSPIRYGLGAVANAWGRWWAVVMDADATHWNHERKLRSPYQFEQSAAKMEADLINHEREYFNEFGISLQQGLELAKEQDYRLHEKPTVEPDVDSIPLTIEESGQLKMF